MKWDRLANDEAVEKASSALKGRGIDVVVVDNGEEARKKVFEIIPEGGEVMQVTSTTLDQIGVSKQIAEGNYKSLRKAIMSITDESERLAMRKKAVSPEYGVGSVHAVTQDGQVLIASRTGSQLPVYAYGATRLVWVVSTKKIVKDLKQGMKRLYEYALPLESERVNKAHNMQSGSSIDKVLIFEREKPGRITLIFVKEKLGF